MLGRTTVACLYRWSIAYERKLRRGERRGIYTLYPIPCILISRAWLQVAYSLTASIPRSFILWVILISLSVISIDSHKLYSPRRSGKCFSLPAVKGYKYLSIPPRSLPVETTSTAVLDLINIGFKQLGISTFRYDELSIRVFDVQGDCDVHKWCWLSGLKDHRARFMFMLVFMLVFDISVEMVTWLLLVFYLLSIWVLFLIIDNKFLHKLQLPNCHVSWG